MRTFICIALILAVVNAKVPWPVENCGTDADTVHFNSAYLNAKPTKGSTNEITLIGDVDEHVEFTEVMLVVKLLGIPVATFHNPYAQTYEAGDTVNYVYNNEIPSFTPSVHNSINII
jgi:hypothetical protein